MHSFKKSIAIVVSIGMIIILFNYMLICKYENLQIGFYEDENTGENIRDKVDTVVVGASESQMGINPFIYDSLTGNSSYVLSEQSEPIEARNYLSADAIKSTPNLKTIIYDYSIDAYYSGVGGGASIEGDINVISKLGFKEKVDYIFNYRGINGIDKLSSMYVFKCIQTLSYGCLTGNYRSDDSIIEMYHGYRGYKSNKELGWIGKTDFNESNFDNKEGSTEALDDLVQLCEENNIRLVVLNMPVSDKYLESESFGFFDEYYYALRAYCSENKVEFYDFNLYKSRKEAFDNNWAFNNVNHLSNKGAESLTKAICEVFETKDMGTNTDELFFDNYDEMMRGMK